MAALKVINAGLHSSVQDLGRFGVSQLGLSQGGALDMHAHCWANKLLNNNPTAATLEITQGQVRFQALHNIDIAITGAETPFFIDGIQYPLWSTHHINSGQTLELSTPISGFRNYLALAGGISSPKLHGSRSVVTRDQIGKITESGDTLQIANLKSTSAQHLHFYSATPNAYIPNYQNQITLRIIPSYQYSLMNTQDVDTFFNTVFSITAKQDRMGVQLENNRLSGLQKNIISEPIAIGAIQLTPNGTTIILLNDHQTLGGYPKIGCVAQIDLPKIAQATTNQKIKFERITRQQAQEFWKTFINFFLLPI